MKKHSFVITAAALGVALSCAGPALAGDPLKGVAKFFAGNVAGTDGKKVAVMTFYYPDGAVSSGSSVVPERLTTYLVNRKGIQVIERSLLHKVLEEVEFQQIGAFDKGTAKRLGKFLGVDAIVIGTLFDVKDRRTEVNARLIEAETGVILAAKSAVIDRTWLDRPQIPPPTPPAPIIEKPKSASAPEKKVPPSITYITIQNPHPAEPAASPMPAAAPPATYITINNPPPSVDAAPIRELPPEPPALVGVPVEQQTVLLQQAREVYVRSREPRQRARALMMIGRIQEQRGQRNDAGRTYHQVATEFPRVQPVVREALQRSRGMQNPAFSRPR
jgi:TolB-like protein